MGGDRAGGENLADLLKRRMADLSNPIQICDAAAANTPNKGQALDTIVAHCLAQRYWVVFGQAARQCMGQPVFVVWILVKGVPYGRSLGYRRFSIHY